MTNTEQISDNIKKIIYSYKYSNPCVSLLNIFEYIADVCTHKRYFRGCCLLKLKTQKCCQLTIICKIFTDFFTLTSIKLFHIWLNMFQNSHNYFSINQNDRDLKTNLKWCLNFFHCIPYANNKHFVETWVKVSGCHLRFQILFEIHFFFPSL